MTLLENEHEKYCKRRADHWSAQVDRQAGLLSLYYHRRLTEIYRHVIGECDSILDLGCGQGNLLGALNPKRGVGVDISKGMIDKAGFIIRNISLFVRILRHSIWGIQHLMSSSYLIY